MYRMAAYCRLSKEDQKSESIENQQKIIQEYAEKSEDLEIVDFYIDDGYSGLYFENRPEFCRMMEDIYKGWIQGVITKDISRLGREHIETSNYIERVFPSLGIRYIAILDGVDSISHQNEELAQFKTLFNDMYSRDISKKIRGALIAQKKRGQFVSGFAPYGYKKDPENRHHFLVDEEAAKVVKRIYQWYLSGYSKKEIAQRLDEEGILIPSEYKRKKQGLFYINPKEQEETSGWSYGTVHMILKNPVYTGEMIQHKTEKLSYKIKKCRQIPESEQIVVEDMHEPVISKDIFQQAQKIGQARVRVGKDLKREIENPYAGLLVCGDCGCGLQKVTARGGYECGNYHRKGRKGCSSHLVHRKILDSIIRDEMERQWKQILNNREAEKMIQRAKEQSSWLEVFIRQGILNKVSRELVIEIVEKIVVYQDGIIEVQIVYGK